MSKVAKHAGRSVAKHDGLPIARLASKKHAYGQVIALDRPRMETRRGEGVAELNGLIMGMFEFLESPKRLSTPGTIALKNANGKKSTRT